MKIPKIIDVGELYGVSFKLILNRETYKGRGRPRKIDYMTLQEAQKRIHDIYNDYLDYLKFRI